jgi:hypothetical protein
MKTMCVSFILACCLLMESCSASAHLGKATISKPDENEKNEQVWFTYYRDQMDAYAGNSVRPAGEIQVEQGYPLQAGNYNPAAVEGYQQAQLDWAVKKKKADRGTALGLGCGIMAVSVLPFLLFIPMIRSAK